MGSAKTAELTKMPFRQLTRSGSRSNIIIIIISWVSTLAQPGEYD